MLLKALIDGSLPKLLFNDIKIFKFFCQDLFPDIPAPEMSHKFKVREIVEQQFEKANFCVQEENVQNVLNIIAAMPMRHGIMVTGAIMAGKTTSLKIVVDALHSLHRMEVQQKTALFKTQKAKTLGIKYETDENGDVHAADRDPVLDSKLRVKMDEVQLI